MEPCRVSKGLVACGRVNLRRLDAGVLSPGMAASGAAFPRPEWFGVAAFGLLRERSLRPVKRQNGPTFHPSGDG